MPRCIINACRRKSRARGLCPECYSSAWRLVQAKRLTWESLIERGMALPIQPRVVERTLFLQALETADARKLRVFHA